MFFRKFGNCCVEDEDSSVVDASHPDESPWIVMMSSLAGLVIENAEIRSNGHSLAEQIPVACCRVPEADREISQDAMQQWCWIRPRDPACIQQKLADLVEDEPMNSWLNWQRSHERRGPCGALASTASSTPARNMQIAGGWSSCSAGSASCRCRFPTRNTN